MNPMLQLLRQAMAGAGIDAYVIFNTDPNSSEYIPQYFMVARALSGFTGDNAIAIVTSQNAYLFTDSRFYISGEIELRGSGFQLMKKASNSDPGFITFLRDHLAKGSVVAFDGNLISQNDYNSLCSKLKPAGIEVRGNVDLTLQFWTSRPQVKLSDIYILPEKFSGKSAIQKIGDIFQTLETNKANHLILTLLDDIAWLLNLRAADIDYCPVFRSFMLMSRHAHDRRITLFLHEGRLSNEISLYLRAAGVSVMDYSDIFQQLSQLPDGDTIQADCNTVSHSIISSINGKCHIQDRKSPVQFAKSVKNDTELQNLRHAMLLDGLAMERFFYKMEHAAFSGIDAASPEIIESADPESITELFLADVLYDERKKGEGFVSESFECISAYNEHAAMPHYAPSKESDIPVKANGVYLVDSGGQYLYGTTDITRTIPTGRFSGQFATDYTLVLMGHIELAMAVFPEGTTGGQLDSLARIHMWRHGRKFGHGTGHGVGYCLNCHEGPHSISTVQNPVSLKPGMVVTDEPGIYIEGQYGIRTENMLCVQKSEYEGFLKFEALTLCHIDTRPVIKSLMTKPQIDYLNSYNARVLLELGPHLSGPELEYLRERTRAI